MSEDQLVRAMEHIASMLNAVKWLIVLVAIELAGLLIGVSIRVAQHG
jgi:hypothetical protein